MKDVDLWGVCVVLYLLLRGSTALVCYTAVESVDLGCLLRWDCPDASPNTTYTVQTKTQGDPWRDVSWCVWVSTRSCDISPAFSNFELYNMIRLGVHISPSATVWNKPRKFDYSDFAFSPPSVHVSLHDERMLVKVQFPCAASRRCSLEGCCPVSRLIDPWTTITVYNARNQSDIQSRTVWSQEVVTYVDFPGLAPGQNYCAVANFSFPTFSMAASAKSSPQCVETVYNLGVLPALLLGAALTSALVFPVLTLFLCRTSRAAAAPGSQSEIKAEDPAPVVPLPTLPALPVDPDDVHVHFPEGQALAEFSPASRTSGTSAGPAGPQSGSGAAYWDRGGLQAGLSAAHTQWV